MSLCVDSLRETPWGFRSFFQGDSIPTDFCSQKLWGLTFLALESWAGRPGVGLSLLALEKSLPNIFPPQMDEGPARSLSVPLLPVWMDVVSLP